MELEQLLADLVRNDVMTAFQYADALRKKLAEDQTAAVRIPHDYLVQVYDSFRTVGDIEREMCIHLVMDLARIAPHLLPGAFASDEPNLSYTLVRQLDEIVRSADATVVREVVMATLQLLNRPGPEQRISDRIRLGKGLDHDALDERLKYRKAIADAVVRVAAQNPVLDRTAIGAIVLQICERPASDASMRGALSICGRLDLTAAVTIACLEHGMRSRVEGVLKEVGLAIGGSCERIVADWSRDHTLSLIRGLGHESSIARRYLAEGLRDLVKAGHRLSGAQVASITLLMCQRNTTLDWTTAARHQISDVPRAEEYYSEALELDESTRMALYDSVASCAGHLPIDDLEECAIVAGDILQGRTMANNSNSSSPGAVTSLAPVTLWADLLTRLLDQMLAHVDDSRVNR
jgi:hypothetical protein